MDSGSHSSEPDPARRSGARKPGAALALLAGLGLAAAATAAPALRMPEGEFAGESWDLIAKLDSGYLVLAQTALSNLGPGDRNAAVIGHLVAPDGSVQRFKRSEPEGKWALVGADQGLDLRSISLEPFGTARRFVVAKNELGIELALGRPGPRNDERRSGPCSFELLETGAPAAAQLRLAPGAPELATRARVAMTHRWSTDLESACALRRVELFVLEPGASLYFSETLAPDGGVGRWMAVERDGRRVFAGDPGDAGVEWAASAEGFAPPASARVAAGKITARFAFDPELASVDPTERLPAAVQWLIAKRTKPRLAWMRAPFEMKIDGRTIAGTAVAKVTYSNPLPGGRIPARVAAHSEE